MSVRREKNVTNPPEPIVELRGIAKQFGGVQALRGVDFDLFPGEVHALVGENGAGKSTLIKIITGAEVPDSGTLTIGGRTVQRLEPAAARSLGIAAIYQQPALFPDLTVAENIALPRDREVDRLLDVVRRLRARGTGIMYISHKLEEIFAVADRITVLRDGESIGTRQRQEIDRSELVCLMVGREPATMYPKRAVSMGAA